MAIGKVEVLDVNKRSVSNPKRRSVKGLIVRRETGRRDMEE